MSESTQSHQDLHVKGHSMTCDEIEKLLYAYVDGELPLEAVALYKDHLEKCPPCKGFVEFEKKISSTIRQKCKQAMPMSLKDKILKALEVTTPKDQKN